MNTFPLHICLIGTWAAREDLPARRIKRRYLEEKKIPTCPWVRALALELVARDDVAGVTVLVHTREVRSACKVERGKLRLIFVPKYEPGQTDPYHLHWPARLQLRSWLKRISPDIVHGFGTETSYGWLAVHSGYTHIVEVQGIISELRPYLGWSRARCIATAYLEKKAVQKADGVIVTSKWGYDWTCRLRDPSDVRYIPNAVSPEFLQERTDYSEPMCVCIGTLAEYKNPQMVIRAFAAVDNANTKLVMIGEGTLKGICEEIAEQHGVANRVFFTGRITREEVIGYLRRARCLAIGSRVDTSPNVVTESLTMGVPVVGANGGGIPNMIRHGEDGFVVLQDDSSRMGEHMGALLEDADLARKMGSAGLHPVRADRSSGNVGQAHVDWYREILARRR